MKPGADTVTMTVPVAPSCPSTINAASVLPFATGTSMNAVPGVVAFGAILATAGLLLGDPDRHAAVLRRAESRHCRVALQPAANG